MERPKRRIVLKSLLVCAVLGGLASLALLSMIALPIFTDKVKSTREAEAISELNDIILAQNAYKSNPLKGNGECASSLSELDWKLDNGSHVTDGPERYQFSTSKSCIAIARSANPQIVPHQFLIMDESRHIRFGY